ncbi:hypothetical protein FOXYS1_13493 [Fusarium oxysporum]|uniref:NAD(P)-binding domain-containing protein n=1 Tax=Fusarium oxysporum TaxID=5507 RepID=A0A8H5ED52_FUSOX|nr:hypothetical protein FOXYS1_13493 [Fusarium oxysporum]
MTARYAKDQPIGFVNHIRKVAIVGANGRIGKVLTEHILRAGQHEVTAITRIGSSSILPLGVMAVVVDYNNEPSLVSALSGQDFLIITLSVTAAPDAHSRLVKAAAKAGVPYIMPNAYGLNFYDSESIRRDIPVTQYAYDNIAEVKQLGLKCIALVVGFWYEYSLTTTENMFGFDLKNRKVTMFDDGRKAIPTSTWAQCGRAVAALLSMKKFPDDESDKSVALSRFHDRPAFVSSFNVSQRDILNSVERVTGTDDVDWEIKYQPAKVRYEEGGKELAESNAMGFYKIMFSRVFYATGDADFESDNQLLGLLEDDLDEATANAMDIMNEK